jgi:hypothetical protein
MYNRYIPQPDGSFRRKSVQEKSPHPPTPPCPEPMFTEPPPKPTVPNCHVPPPRQNSRRSYRRPAPAKQEDSSVTGFLRRLLPKDFDTGDLIVVLLLLLMAGDCAEEQNTALLTLAQYFFM